MKNRCLIIPAVMASVLFSCTGENGQVQQQTLEDISKQELATALNERDELLSLVKEISAGLQQIKRLENVMAVAAANPDENAGQRQRILSEIAGLREAMRQRREQLRKLEEKLRDSTINNKDLQETIEALRIQIDSQMEEIEVLRRQLTAANLQIGELSSSVDSLNTAVSAVTGERDTAREISVRLENELNTCYYVAATKSELKEHNIIESGFLRKTRLMEGDYDKGFFTVSDKRNLTVLPLNSGKVKILTKHPESSYEIMEEDGRKVIRIKDPDAFWSLTNYLVIQKD